jgi:tetratricopeptide (TPR) repeat protein
MAARTRAPQDQWLEENHPGLLYTLRALDGDRPALRWLRVNAPGLYHLCRALQGREGAGDALRGADPAERAVLVEIMDNADLLKRIRGRHPELYELLRAGRGDAAALRRLRRRRAALATAAAALREAYRAGGSDGPQELTGGAAADVGLLVGEMHLQRGEYVKAVEAFTRALEREPTADAYEGRARAYLGLAREDERRAATLRTAAR